MDLAQKIRSLREDKEWTQGDLAEKSGVGKSSIQLYESGKGNITQLNLEKIASAFGVNVSYFLNDKMSNSLSISVHKSSPNMSISPEKSEKLQKMQNLISEQENKLINLRFFPNVSAAAGYGANNDNESFKSIPVTASFLTTILRIPAKQYDVINVLGNGEIVIANLGGDLYVKKLLKDPIKKRIRLTSMNELYEDIVVEDDELDQLKIVGVVKKVLPSGAISI